MRPDLLVFGIESGLCVVVALCAIAYAIMRRRRMLRMCGVTIVMLSALIIAEVIGAAVLDFGTPATVTAQPARPTVAGPDTKALQEFSTSWATIVRVSASAFRAHDAAGEYLQHGDAVEAAAELKNCQATASGIVTDSRALPLDVKNRADSELLTAVEKIGEGLTNGCKSARSYLDTSAQSDFTAAHAHFSDVVEGLVQAESLARLKFQSLGGDPDTLLSFKTALR
ncbi:MAG TPA: hypothetical protein VGU66_05635 [Candidatus Elarobacter sp.]|nr:hypothetical protein [Candidatus Elarobacter sp.]